MAPYWPQAADCASYVIILGTFCHILFVAGQQQAPVASEPVRKIIIPNLPLSHYQFWLKNNPSALQSFEKLCAVKAGRLADDIQLSQQLDTNFTFEGHRFINEEHTAFRFRILKTICDKINLVRKSCWGYEKDCEYIYLMPECSASDSENEQNKKIEWFSQADFGYILDRRYELTRYCAPDKHSGGSIKSSLECTKYFRTCRGENLYMNLSGNQSLGRPQDSIIMRKGQVGGWNCDLQLKRIQEENKQRGFLRSWFTELEHYQKLTSIEPAKACEEHIDKQVYLIQLDSPFNMYHYFCNFINLYATMHLYNRFSEDNQIIFWDRKLPNSQFEDMWSVFSKNKPKSLNELVNKQVCFRKFIFAMPPRMIHGLYYGTPLVEGCTKSGLFDAFNKHVLYKLGIDMQEPNEKKLDRTRIRVTIVSRSTPTRRILNEHDLKTASNNISNEFQTQIVDFANMTFLEQLKITHNTDILVGVHGAGLTHTLFLPDWAALYELYDCGDESYRDLARMRGVSYFNLKDGKNTGKKSNNFTIDVNSFIETLKSAAHVVKRRLADLVQNSEDESGVAEAGLPATENGVKPEISANITDLNLIDAVSELKISDLKANFNRKEGNKTLSEMMDKKGSTMLNDTTSAKSKTSSNPKKIEDLKKDESKIEDAGVAPGVVEDKIESETTRFDADQIGSETDMEPGDLGANEGTKNQDKKERYKIGSKAEHTEQGNRTAIVTEEAKVKPIAKAIEDGPKQAGAMKDSEKHNFKVDNKVDEIGVVVENKTVSPVTVPPTRKAAAESKELESNESLEDKDLEKLRKNKLLKNPKTKKRFRAKYQNSHQKEDAGTSASTTNESKLKSEQHTEL